MNERNGAKMMRGGALLVGFALVAAPAESRQPVLSPAGATAASTAPAPAKPPRARGPSHKAPAAPKPQEDAAAPAEQQSPPADPSAEAWHVINWVIASHDNNDLPFVVLDKVAAQMFVFDSTGQKIASAPALVGMTAGDEATPGVGDREMSNIKPEDRKTPAGRFVAKFGRAAGHRDGVLWVDFPSAISIHAVIKVGKQHRLERLNSPTADDNRITYGCINVPTEFYVEVLKPLFRGTSGIVYVLPEVAPLATTFPAMPRQAAVTY
jgi:hypothetical protein